MRRYEFLDKNNIQDALDSLRSAFLAAKDGNDVDEIINAILTYDEQMKVGRRILISQLFSSGLSFEEIASELSVGRSTIANVLKQMDINPQGFELIDNREEKESNVLAGKSFRQKGGSLKVLKGSVKTDFSKKDVKR